MLKTIVNRGWYPALITALAVVSLIYGLSINIIVPVLVALLFIGLIAIIVDARNSKLEAESVKLTQLASHFNRRFMGNSSLSIFPIIDGVFSIENPQVWEWARACGTSKRIFDTWSDNFTNRAENDLRSRRYKVFLNNHLNELWAINNHYYEFIEQFSEIAEKFTLPSDLIAQYNKFAGEYNLFVQTFRDTLTELKNIARIQIEAPSIKLARELPGKK
jgi:ABC-type long-subunit fatty acid transport system fused permease/ATPase subunit